MSIRMYPADGDEHPPVQPQHARYSYAGNHHYPDARNSPVQQFQRPASSQRAPSPQKFSPYTISPRAAVGQRHSVYGSPATTSASASASASPVSYRPSTSGGGGGGSSSVLYQPRQPLNQSPGNRARQRQSMYGSYGGYGNNDDNDDDDNDDKDGDRQPRFRTSQYYQQQQQQQRSPQRAQRYPIARPTRNQPNRFSIQPSSVPLDSPSDARRYAQSSASKHSAAEPPLIANSPSLARDESVDQPPPPPPPHHQQFSQHVTPYRLKESRKPATQSPAAVAEPPPRKEKKPDFSMKFVVVGDGGCGKTCLLITYAQSYFPETYVPTVFENYITRKPQKSTGKTVELALWDTAGQEEYDRLRPLSYPETDLVFICFAIDCPSSLENVQDKWYPEVLHFCPTTPFILVGLKSDLRAKRSCVELLRTQGLVPVSRESGSEAASRMGAKYSECSSKEYANVDHVFDLAIDTVVDFRGQRDGDGDYEKPVDGGRRYTRSGSMGNFVGAGTAASAGRRRSAVKKMACSVL